MNNLKAGFCRMNITPMLGIDLIGYFKTRLADGVLDELELNALALSAGDKKVLIFSLDNEGINRETIADLASAITEATGVCEDSIYIHCTHTHTGPFIKFNSEKPLEQEYYSWIRRRLCDAAVMALEDLKPARMGWAIGNAPNIAFVRRFRMKDGSVMTNPGVNNPDIVAPIGDVDERVNVLRFDREGAESIVVVNFGNHPDTVGGNKISGDWPTLMRHSFEKAIDNVKCMMFNGVQGDVNHVNVHPTGGYLNDTFNDFDDVSRGYGHTRFMGRVVAAGVMQVFDKVCYVDVDNIRSKKVTIKVPSNMPTPEQIPEAHRINDLHLAGKDSELPYKGMMLTTVVAEAGRMVKLEHGPEAFEMELTAIAIGNLVMIGLPGEPFTGIGRALKEAKGWDLVLPSCLTNGSEGYFPMQDAYDEGGYEARSSRFAAGVAEFLVKEGTKLLDSMR